MRRPALLLLPVLLAGSLRRVQQRRRRPTCRRCPGEYGQKPKVTVAKGTKPAKKLDYDGALRGRRAEGRQGRPAGRRLPRRGLQERQGVRQLLRPQGAGRVPDRRRRRHRRLGQEPGRRQRRQPGADGRAAQGRLRQDRATRRPASRAPTRWSSSSTSSRRTRSPARRRRTPRSTDLPDRPADGQPASSGAEPTITVPAGTTPPEGARRSPCSPRAPARRWPRASSRSSSTPRSAGPARRSAARRQGRDGRRQGPQGVPIGGAQPSPFDLLVGVPAGSRVLLTLPAQTGHRRRQGERRRRHRRPRRARTREGGGASDREARDRLPRGPAARATSRSPTSPRATAPRPPRRAPPSSTTSASPTPPARSSTPPGTAGRAFAFPLGAGNVIAGWDRGVVGMKVGGRRRLVIPPELGYGDRGAGAVIAPGETLIFVVDLARRPLSLTRPCRATVAHGTVIISEQRRRARTGTVGSGTCPRTRRSGCSTW